MPKSTKTVGIDFGTSTTLVAVQEGETAPRVIPIGDTTSWMPSLLAVDGDGTFLAGEAARSTGHGNVISSIKSALTAGTASIETSSGPVPVRDGIRALLAEAVQRAQRAIPGIFDDAEVYMGCPALWTGRERKLLAGVAHDCGLDVDIGQIIDEPVAAGLHWINSQWQSGAERPTGKTIVFDAGGGTLDVAYLDVGGDEVSAMTVLAAEGVGESGDALDRTIEEWLKLQLAEFDNDPTFRAQLRAATRTLKEALSYSTTAAAPVGTPYETVVELDRDRLELLFADQLKRAQRLAQSVVRGGLLRVAQPWSPTAIRAARWEDLAGEVRHVALVGGLSQMPSVRRELELTFPRALVSLVSSPQESVVRGLTLGHALDELNLPRPPVDFRVMYGNHSAPVDVVWQLQSELVYEAFSPLYSQADVISGNSLLGFVGRIPIPPGSRGRFSFEVRCVMPNRERTELMMRLVGDPNGDDLETAIHFEHDSMKEPLFKLYTNGDLLIRSSRREFLGHVASWPRLRGPNHDYHREITIHRGDRKSVSKLRLDDWRFQ